MPLLDLLSDLIDLSLRIVKNIRRFFSSDEKSENEDE